MTNKKSALELLRDRVNQAIKNNWTVKWRKSLLSGAILELAERVQSIEAKLEALEAKKRSNMFGTMLSEHYRNHKPDDLGLPSVSFPMPDTNDAPKENVDLSPTIAALKEMLNGYPNDVSLRASIAILERATKKEEK